MLLRRAFSFKNFIRIGENEVLNTDSIVQAGIYDAKVRKSLDNELAGIITDMYAEIYYMIGAEYWMFTFGPNDVGFRSVQNLVDSVKRIEEPPIDPVVPVAKKLNVPIEEPPVAKHSKLVYKPYKY